MMSCGQFQSKNQSVEVLRGCRNKGSTGKVQIIDVDDGKVEFVTVDVAETSHKGSGGFRESTSKENSPIGNIIDIDDGESNHVVREGSCDNLSSTPSSSSSHICDFNDGDDSIIFVKEGKAAKENVGFCSGRVFVDLNKPYMNDVPVGESFDLSSSENDASENGVETGPFDGESSDCEIADGFSDIREDWQRAASRKQTLGRAQNVSDGLVTASESSSESGNAFCETHQENAEVQDDAHNPFSRGRQFNYPYFHFDIFTSNAGCSFDCSDECIGNTFHGQDGFSFAPQKIDHTTSVPAKEEVSSGLPSWKERPDVRNQGPKQSFFNYNNGEPEMSSMCGQNNVHVPCDVFQVKSPETCKNDPPAGGTGSVASFNKHSADLEGNHLCKQKENVCHEKICTRKEVFEPRDTIQKKSLETSNNVSLAGGAMSDNGLPDPKGTNSDSWRENSLLGDREKHKKSEEYRRADEEEWVARHEQLRIQAEEVHKMRKRKKAETLRLLDMERRQKQRLEEVRESQKKNEETINLKEQLRSEVRKQLDLVESQNWDMASLLRALGIQVGGGRTPSPQEVNSAYKKALLAFHPDRASRTDVRLQVESEEKFKLVSRLKEKLLPAAW